MQLRGSILALTALATLAGCQTESEEQTDSGAGENTPEAEASPSPSPDVGETVSILRPDIEQGNLAQVIEPLEVTIGFPDGGSDLDTKAVEQLEEVLVSEQLKSGGTILLGGHSDTAGSDRVNLRAGRERAEAVRDWLVAKGVDEARIEVLTFGEQNPLEPNARPDGMPNEAGRAINRRVEILITPPEEPAN